MRSRRNSNKSLLSNRTTNDTDTTGLIDNINSIQYDTLVKLKEIILEKNILSDFSTFDNAYMLRFLRARKFDLEKSLAMFDEYIKWRKIKQVDKLLVNFFS